MAIAGLSRAVLDIWRQSTKGKNRGVRLTVSTSCFIPKPHTPFQWEAQISISEYLRRVELLKGALRTKAITYNWHSPEQTFIESALSRGDRRVGAVVEAAWKLGARMDSWSEYFSLEKWLEAFAGCGLDPEHYALRERKQSEVLPWSLISTGVETSHLRDERFASQACRKSPDCRKSCSGCGAAKLLGRGCYDG